MKQGRPYISKLFKGSIISALAVILPVGLVHADEPENTPESTAAKSLEAVLKKAGEEGLLQVGNGEETDPEAPVKSAEVQAYEHLLAADTNCALSDIFDFSAYVDVTNFDQVIKLKSSTTNVQHIEDVIPLAKTYFALGLGAEVVSLVQAFDDPKAYALASFARVLEENPRDLDLQLIDKISDCNDASRFWGLVADASHGRTHDIGEIFELSLGQLQYLEDLPEHLERTITTRLGIHASENRSKKLAEQLLTKLEPKNKVNLLPSVRSDERLYFYALVRKYKGDKAAQQILSYLGQHEGLYRTRSLHQLVRQSSEEGAKLYEDFDQDLLAVRHQYKGQSQGNEATVEIIRQQMKTDKYVTAMALAKSEFTADEPSMIDAVNVIGHRLQERLEDPKPDFRLLALNGYMHDVDFFAPYPRLEDLTKTAYHTAIDLNLPELALLVPYDHEKDLATTSYAKARIAYKKSDYSEVLSAAEKHKSDARFDDLALKAAIALGDQTVSGRVLEEKAKDEKKYTHQARIAWRNGDWNTAATALQNAAGETPDVIATRQMAVANYVSEITPNANVTVPGTAAELAVFNASIDDDLAIVKAFLTHG